VFPRELFSRQFPSTIRTIRVAGDLVRPVNEKVIVVGIICIAARIDRSAMKQAGKARDGPQPRGEEKL